MHVPSSSSNITKQHSSEVPIWEINAFGFCQRTMYDFQRVFAFPGSRRRVQRADVLQFCQSARGLALAACLSWHTPAHTINAGPRPCLPVYFSCLPAMPLFKYRRLHRRKHAKVPSTGVATKSMRDELARLVETVAENANRKVCSIISANKCAT
jgi:hypothetical protein